MFDEDLGELLQRVAAEDAAYSAGRGDLTAFANTLVILFADHGPRMGDARLSIQVCVVYFLTNLSIVHKRTTIIGRICIFYSLKYILIR